MQSKMNLRQDVKAGKLEKEKALAILRKIIGGENTQTYRRIVRM